MGQKQIDKLEEFLYVLLAFLFLISFFCLTMLGVNKYAGFFNIAIVCILLGSLFYIIISKNARNYLQRDHIKRNIKLFSWLSLLFAGLSVFFMITIDLARDFQAVKDSELSLFIENAINQGRVENILQDEEQEWIYWEKFSLLSYNPNLSYIARYKNTECKRAYSELINGMEVINAINTAIQDLTNQAILLTTPEQLNLNEAKFKELKNLIRGNALIVDERLDYIMENCITDWWTEIKPTEK